MATNTTSTLTAVMQRYYDRNFILRQRDILVWDQFAQKKKVPANQGKDLYFTRYSPLARATTPLTEGSNPTDVSLSAANVTASLVEYGNYTKIGKLLALSAIDPKIKESVSIMAQNAAETIDRLTREAVFAAATVTYANGRGSLAAVTITDVLTSTDVRKVVRNLKKGLALRFADGFYAGIAGPDTTYDLMGDTVWTNAKTYSDVKELYKGEIGELHGSRFVETTDQKSEASTTTVYSNFIFGQQSYGMVDLEGDEQKIYVKVPGPQNTENPLERYSTIGWAQSFVAVALVPTWIYSLKTGATV
jgi:N4-gp56 family major capsid protein